MIFVASALSEKVEATGMGAASVNVHLWPLPYPSVHVTLKGESAI
jgi:hypothetical protein